VKKIIQKLVFGDLNPENNLSRGSLNKRVQNIKAIWNNDHHDDVGIEKIFRLFLASSQFLFPGIYIKHIFGKNGSKAHDLAMDIYITLKVCLPLCLIYFQINDLLTLLAIVIWFLIETILYVPSLIFASDTIASPSSYRRSMLLLFLNYFEITFSFALIYSHGNYLNQPFKYWYDPIYFSFTTIGSIGFGDFYPVTGLGKFLVCFQTVIFLAFVVLFINYFSNRVENKGYFSKENENL